MALLGRFFDIILFISSRNDMIVSKEKFFIINKLGLTVIFAMKVILLIVILSLLTACSSKPYVVKHTEMPAAVGQEEIYIVSHGWHTGLVVPAKGIQNILPKLRKRFGDIPYIEFGWGDKDYYQAREITSGLTLKAI